MRTSTIIFKTLRQSKLTRIAAVVISFTFASLAYASESDANEAVEIDKAVMAAPLPNKFETHQYNAAVVRLALEKSQKEYGEFSLKNSKRQYSGARALVALNQPESELNVHVTVTSAERESGTIPIRIPIRFGILGYRLILINEKQRAAFASIKTADQLLAKKAGVVSNWITADVYRAKKAAIEEGYSTPSIFKMLNADRFDYLSRGINEVYNDMTLHGKGLNNVIVEPSLAIYLPLPYYIFIAKKNPGLAARIQSGLNQALDDGSLYTLFMSHHKETIKVARLNERRIIYLSNPILPPKTPTQRKELWYFHSEEFGKTIFNH